MYLIPVFLCLSLSLKDESKLKLSNLSPYLYSISNFSLKQIHSCNMKNLLNLYSKHPIFIGIPKHSNIELTISNIDFHQNMVAPLLHGQFSHIHLNSLSFSQNNFDSIIQIDNSNIIEINDTKEFQKNGFLDIFFDSIVTITNCHFSQFIPTNNHNSLIQSYGANISIQECSFHQCFSNTSPILFSAISDISISYSNFSSNFAEDEGVFSMTRTTGFSHRCLYYDNIATENGVCSISDSNFNFTSNSFFHNKAEKNSIVYIMTSNSTFDDNVFVANRLHAVFYGIVSIYDNTKISSNISFINCIFSLNKYFDEFDHSKTINKHKFQLNKQNQVQLVEINKNKFKSLNKNQVIKLNQVQSKEINKNQFEEFNKNQFKSVNKNQFNEIKKNQVRKENQNQFKEINKNQFKSIKKNQLTKENQKKKIKENQKKNLKIIRKIKTDDSKIQSSVYSIYYRGDEIVTLDHCIFNTDYSDSLIAFDGASFKNADSKFNEQVKTPYDSYDDIYFKDLTYYSIDFHAAKSTLILILFMLIFSIVIAFVLYGLWRVSKDVQPI